MRNYSVAATIAGVVTANTAMVLVIIGVSTARAEPSFPGSVTVGVNSAAWSGRTPTPTAGSSGTEVSATGSTTPADGGPTSGVPAAPPPAAQPTTGEPAVPDVVVVPPPAVELDDDTDDLDDSDIDDSSDDDDSDDDPDDE
jgi:hypothetical protein